MSTRLAAGDTAPDFTAPTDSGTFTLSHLRGKNVIVYFYPCLLYTSDAADE